MSATLLERLAECGPALAASVLDNMYEDPFWQARFGARGRRHAEEDSRYHVQYLVEAVRANDPEVMARYALWLRSVLVSRGMCSAHLAENFTRLGRAIARDIPDADLAVRVLEGARDALRHPGGVALWLDHEAERLSTRAAALALKAEAAPEGTASLANCLAQLLSYAADALALGNPEVWTKHATWVADIERSAPLHAWSLLTQLRLLEEVLSTETSDHAREARDLLRLANSSSSP